MAEDDTAPHDSGRHRDTPARETPRRETERDERTGRSAAAERIRHQGQWVEQQLRIAQERGDFDDLAGFGKPLQLTEQHDPDWWIKGLVEREQLSVLPPALALRKADAEFDGELDAIAAEDAVRRAVEEFNARVRHTLYSNPGGPPVVTSPRDPDTEVTRWRERREERRRTQRAQLEQQSGRDRGPRRQPWWRRSSG